MKDWGLAGASQQMDAALEGVKMLRLHSPSLSLAGDEFASTSSSTPAFTPRMTKLLGPGTTPPPPGSAPPSFSFYFLLSCPAGVCIHAGKVALTSPPTPLRPLATSRTQPEAVVP